MGNGGSVKTDIGTYVSNKNGLSIKLDEGAEKEINLMLDGSGMFFKYGTSEFANSLVSGSVTNNLGKSGWCNYINGVLDVSIKTRNGTVIKVRGDANGVQVNEGDKRYDLQGLAIKNFTSNDPSPIYQSGQPYPHPSQDNDLNDAPPFNPNYRPSQDSGAQQAPSNDDVQKIVQDLKFYIGKREFSAKDFDEIKKLKTTVFQNLAAVYEKIDQKSVSFNSKGMMQLFAKVEEPQNILADLHQSTADDAHKERFSQEFSKITELQALKNQIFTKDWKLGAFGGTQIKSGDEKKKVPAHVAQIYKCIESGLSLHGDPAKAWKEIGQIASEVAGKNKMGRTSDTSMFYEGLKNNPLTSLGRAKGNSSSNIFGAASSLMGNVNDDRDNTKGPSGPGYGRGG